MNGTNRTLWWIPRIFAAIGFALLLWASWFYSREHGFVASAAHAAGTVIDLNYRPSSDGGAYYPIFRFTDARGQAYTVASRVGRRPASKHVGQVVDVLYDPDYPEDARMAGFFQLYTGTFITTLLAGIFGGIGAIWLLVAHRGAAREEELRHSGLRIEAKVVGVEQRRAITVNRKHPWRIIAEAQEPSRAGQIFRSGNIWMDPTPYVKETVHVFVDRNDPKKHFIDLEFLPKD